MVKSQKFNLHSLFIAIASLFYECKQSKTYTLSYSITLLSLQKFVTVVHDIFNLHFLLGNFYSYKTARTCCETCSVELRLSFAVEVMTASENLKHPLPLKIIFSAASNGYYVLEMADI